MPRMFLDPFENKIPFTPGRARTWLLSTGVTVSPALDAWIPDFLNDGNKGYGFLRQKEFRDDLRHWVGIHTFSLVFAADPLAMLRNHLFVTDDPNIADTAAIATYITVDDHRVIIGPLQFCEFFEAQRTLGPTGRPQRLQGTVNYTAMRSNQAGNRSAPPHITAAGTWWFTPVQTGCTVVICDWGGGSYSMTHLQPYDDDQYPSVLQYVLGKSMWIQAEFKMYALQTNVSAVVAASGREPQRYILVQSNHTAETENVVVIGHRHGGAGPWQFFYQRYPRGSFRGPVTAAGALEWQTWNDPWDLVGAYHGAI